MNIKYIILVFLMSCTVTANDVIIVVDDKTIDGDDYAKVIEPVWWSVSIYDGPETYERDLKKFSKEQRHVFACEWYSAEVNNGGHHQFYFNSTGIVWKDAMEGFAALGAQEIADIIRESARRMGGNPSLIREDRWKQLEQTGVTFDDLDNRYYDLEYKLRLDKKILDYIRKNRTRFYFSGKVKKP